MKKFITIQSMVYKDDNLGMGEEERTPITAKIDPDAIIAYRDCTPDKEDEVAVFIHLSDGTGFYSPISMEEFEKLLNPQPEDYGMIEVPFSTAKRHGLI